MNLKMKLLTAVSVMITLFVLTFFTISAGTGLAFELNAHSAILVDAETGQVLYEENADEELPPASLTKIMTMLLAMEAVDAGEISLEDTVTISQSASDMGGSQIFLDAGHVLTVEELLKAVTIASANDATYALSEAIGGTYSSFVEMMNERAEELGMENTNFTNSTGLPDENLYTTARDVAKMSREVIKYPEIREWGQTWVEYIEVPGREIMLANLNLLVRDYPGMDGIKTGRTQEAGYCLSASAEREGARLISVVMNADSDEERQNLTRRLLNYGFNNYIRETLLSGGETVRNIEFPGSSQGEVSALAESDLQVMVEVGSEPDFEREIVLIDDYEFPIEEGEKIGEMIVYDEYGEKLNSTVLLAEDDINRAGIFSRLFRLIIDFFAGLLR